jgi:DNA-binding transcriptional ArsR family regulator
VEKKVAATNETVGPLEYLGSRSYLMSVAPADGQPEGGERSPVSGASELSVFAALADPTRLRLLELLVEMGRASATTLAGNLPVSRQAVMKQLHVLDEVGLVTATRSGRQVLYVACAATLDASARWLTDLSAAWRRGTAQTVGESGEA